MLKRTAILMLACLLSVCGLALPAEAERVSNQVRVRYAADGSAVVTIPADGRLYSVGGFSMRATPAVPSLTITNCDIGFNAPVKLFVLGWPSIVNTGGIICYSPVTGQAVMMGSVSLVSKLILGTQTLATQSKVWNFQIVAEFWSWPMATCVANPNRLYRQSVWSGASTMGGMTDSGSALSVASSLPCRHY